MSEIFKIIGYSAQDIIESDKVLSGLGDYALNREYLLFGSSECSSEESLTVAKYLAPGASLAYAESLAPEVFFSVSERGRVILGCGNIGSLLGMNAISHVRCLHATEEPVRLIGGVNGRSSNLAGALVDDFTSYPWLCSWEASLFAQVLELADISSNTAGLELLFATSRLIEPKDIAFDKVPELTHLHDFNEDQFIQSAGVFKKHLGFVPSRWIHLTLSDADYESGEYFYSYAYYLQAFNGDAETRLMLQKSKPHSTAAETFSELKRIGLDIHRTPFVSLSAEDFRESRRIEDSGLKPWDSESANVQRYQVEYLAGRTIGYSRAWMEYEFERSRSMMEDLASKRKHDTCVVVGNGPSLQKTNLSLLSGQDVFVSNYAAMNPELKEYATYLCVTNPLVAEQGVVALSALRHLIRFYPFFLAYWANPQDRQTAWLNSGGRQPFFGTGLGEMLSWHSTVTHFSLQIAYQLGYKKVLLIGVDNTYKQQSHQKEGDLIKQKEDDSNHFDPRYFKGKNWQAADTDKMAAVYELAKEAYECAGREVVNCTVGGALEVFRRGSLKTELEVPVVIRKNKDFLPTSLANLQKKKALLEGAQDRIPVTPLQLEGLRLKCASSPVAEACFSLDVRLVEEEKTTLSIGGYIIHSSGYIVSGMYCIVWGQYYKGSFPLQRSDVKLENQELSLSGFRFFNIPVVSRPESIRIELRDEEEKPIVLGDALIYPPSKENDKHRIIVREVKCPSGTIIGQEFGLALKANLLDDKANLEIRGWLVSFAGGVIEGVRVVAGKSVYDGLHGLSSPEVAYWFRDRIHFGHCGVRIPELARKTLTGGVELQVKLFESDWLTIAHLKVGRFSRTIDLCVNPV